MTRLHNVRHGELWNVWHPVFECTAQVSTLPAMSRVHRQGAAGVLVPLLVGCSACLRCGRHVSKPLYDNPLLLLLAGALPARSDNDGCSVEQCRQGQPAPAVGHLSGPLQQRCGAAAQGRAVALCVLSHVPGQPFSSTIVSARVLVAWLLGRCGWRGMLQSCLLSHPCLVAPASYISPP